MGVNPTVSRITIYPVKSLDGIFVNRAKIGKSCLLHDREYAILDSNNRFINGKSNALVHSMRKKIDLENETISFRHDSEVLWKAFHLQNEKPAINDYLSGFFNEPATFSQNKEGRFMDIPDIAGLTVVSTASLESVAAWFGDMDMEEVRKRFRATIEISAVPAFWEDKLFIEEGTAIEFKIGNATILGISPRARCVVPTRHPQTGETIHAFPKIFARGRADTIPSWSALERYGHSYYLTVNCYIPPSESGKWIETGDEIKITGRRITR